VWRGSYSAPVFTRITGFDLAGRPLGKTSPADGDDGNASRVTTYSYVGRETRIHVCGNVGGVCLDMSRSQDSLGRFVRTLDAQGGLTRTWADGSGNVVALQDVAGSTIRATYNALGQRIAVNDPNQGSSNFSYNALGEVLSSTDGRGISTSNSYDKLGRLIGRSASVDVDGNGSADSVLDQWTYDPVGAAGALQSSQRTLAGVLERSEQHSYDLHGRRLQTDTTQAVLLGEPRVYTQRFAYDASYGRLKARSLPHLTTASGEVIWTRYSAYGQPTRESDGRTGVDYRQITAVDASGQPTQELLGGHW
jgi:YD repeat-containing protein